MPKKDKYGYTKMKRGSSLTRSELRKIKKEVKSWEIPKKKKKIEKGFYKLGNIKINHDLEVLNVKRRTVDKKIDPLGTMNSKFIYMGNVYHKGKKITEVGINADDKEAFIWWVKKDNKVKQQIN